MSWEQMLQCTKEEIYELDLYDILQVPFDATEKEVRKSCKKMLRKYHTDKNPNIDKNVCNQITTFINNAYLILTDEELRSKYDVLYSPPIPQQHHELKLPPEHSVVENVPFKVLEQRLNEKHSRDLKKEKTLKQELHERKNDKKVNQFVNNMSSFNDTFGYINKSQKMEIIPIEKIKTYEKTEYSPLKYDILYDEEPHDTTEYSSLHQVSKFSSQDTIDAEDMRKFISKKNRKLSKFKIQPSMANKISSYKNETEIYSNLTEFIPEKFSCNI